MARDDTAPQGSVQAAWRAFVHRVAAVAGSLTGLLSLLWDAPVTAASLRGALAWTGALVLGRLVSVVLSRTVLGEALNEPEPAETS